jgi:hypothetical protein
MRMGGGGIDREREGSVRENVEEGGEGQNRKEESGMALGCEE